METIQRVGIVGAGTMGNGIAQACAAAGLAAVMVDVDDAAVARGTKTIAGSLDRLVKKEKLTAAERDAALAELAQPGAPFRALAMEQQAIALMADGKTGEAVALARQVLQEPDATPGLQRRVTQLIVALGGDPDAG